MFSLFYETRLSLYCLWLCAGILNTLPPVAVGVLHKAPIRFTRVSQGPHGIQTHVKGIKNHNDNYCTIGTWRRHVFWCHANVLNKWANALQFSLKKPTFFLNDRNSREFHAISNLKPLKTTSALNFVQSFFDFCFWACGACYVWLEEVQSPLAHNWLSTKWSHDEDRLKRGADLKNAISTTERKMKSSYYSRKPHFFIPEGSLDWGNTNFKKWNWALKNRRFFTFF